MKIATPWVVGPHKSRNWHRYALLFHFRSETGLFFHVVRGWVLLAGQAVHNNLAQVSGGAFECPPQERFVVVEAEQDFAVRVWLGSAGDLCPGAVGVKEQRQALFTHLLESRR